MQLLIVSFVFQLTRSHLSVSQPFKYAQECLCWADTARKAALPYYALFCLSLWWNIWWILALVTTGTNDITNSQYRIPPSLPPLFESPHFFYSCLFCFTSFFLSLSLPPSPSLPPFLHCVCLSVHVEGLSKVFRVLSRKLLASLKKFCMKATVVRKTIIIATFQWKKIFSFLLKPIKWRDYSPNIQYVIIHTY